MPRAWSNNRQPRDGIAPSLLTCIDEIVYTNELDNQGRVQRRASSVKLKYGGSFPVDGQLGRQGPSLRIRWFPSFASLAPTQKKYSDPWARAAFNLASALPQNRQGQQNKGQAIDRSLFPDVTVTLYANPYMRDDVLEADGTPVSVGRVPNLCDEFGFSHQVTIVDPPSQFEMDPSNPWPNCPLCGDVLNSDG